MYLKRNKELGIIALYTGNYAVEFYLRQISKTAKIALKTCQNVLANLEKDKILLAKTVGKNKYFRLNLDNIETKSYLLKAEIHKTDIFLKKHPEFKSFLKEVNASPVIILFGSFAKSTENKDSDVDIFVVSGKEEKLPAHLLPYKIHQNTLTESSFKKAALGKETIIKELEENHIILNNHSLYVNIIWEIYGK